MRVWEILVHTRSQTSLTLAKDRRIRFFQELEERGETVIMRALDSLSAHIQWILVSGGENSSKTKTASSNRLFAASGGVSVLNSIHSFAVLFHMKTKFIPFSRSI